MPRNCLHRAMVYIILADIILQERENYQQMKHAQLPLNGPIVSALTFVHFGATNEYSCAWEGRVIAGVLVIVFGMKFLME